MKYLPSIFTLLNLFCGYYALYSAYKGDFQAGAIAILFAIFFDILDGRLARLSTQVTNFGKELDSLADMVSFGVSPAFLIYQFSLSAFGRQGFLVSFLYVACTALRLARFNIRASSLSQFEGLPSPAAGALIASTVLLLLFLRIESEELSYPLLLMVCIVSFLMVSPLRYPSLKDFRLKGLRTSYFLVLFLFLIILAASKLLVILFVLVLIYILLGPFLFVKDFGLKILRKRKGVLKKDNL